jgi:uncharacterized membrane protein YgcG
MRKSTLFVSAMLTVFLMATVFGVVSAYQQVVKNNTAATAQKANSQPVQVDFAPVPTEAVITTPLVVTAEEATTIAVDFLGDPNVFSVEVVDYQGAPTYLVTFSSGDLVYVSSTGMVVANTKMQPVVVAASSGGNGGGGQGNNSGGSSGGGNQQSNNNGHEEHESEGDD